MKNEFKKNESVLKFEKMLEQGNTSYYDAEEFCDIIAHYLDIMDTHHAKKALTMGLDQHPQSVEIRIKKLEYFLASEKLDLAKQLISQLSDFASNDTDYLICRAKFYSLSDCPERSIHFYQKALLNKEETDYIYNCIGNEYLNLDNSEKALIAFKKALKHNLSDEYALSCVVQCYDELEKPEECKRFLKTYIDKKPYSEQAWYLLGQQYLEDEQYPEALEAFDYATLINQYSITAYTHKAEVLELMGNAEKAIETYQEILSFDDYTAFTHLKIGEVHFKQKDYTKALVSFMKSVKEDPQLARTWASVSKTYEKLENYKEALYYIQKALEVNLDDVDYLKQAAYLNVHLQFYEESILLLERIIAIEPQNFFNWYSIIELLLVVGNYEYAIPIAQDAIKKHKRAALYYQLSVAYFKTEDETMGFNFLKKAIKKSGNKMRNEMTQKYPILNDKVKRIELLK